TPASTAADSCTSLFCCVLAAPTRFATPSLHDALPILICFASTSVALPASNGSVPETAKYPTTPSAYRSLRASTPSPSACSGLMRSEEHTSELQSLRHLVCRLLLEKKKNLAGCLVSAN